MQKTLTNPVIYPATRLDHAYVANPSLCFDLPLGTSRNGVSELTKEASSCGSWSWNSEHIWLERTLLQKPQTNKQIALFLSTQKTHFDFDKTMYVFELAHPHLQSLLFSLHELGSFSFSWLLLGTGLFISSVRYLSIHFVMNTDGSKSVSISQRYCL